ncbi:MAG: hypothetical protein ACI85U_001288 [Candidatus Promineifilaceae bacterium]|jgi:hypothetical protein
MIYFVQSPIKVMHESDFTTIFYMDLKREFKQAI